MERKFFRCTETGNFYDKEQLKALFEEFKEEKTDDMYKYLSFERYLELCMARNNGTLEEVKFYFFIRSGCFWECTEDIKATAYYDDDLDCIVDSFGREYHIIKYMEDFEKVMTYKVI